MSGPLGKFPAMTHPADDGVWRDEEKLPLSELDQAMATWDTDGQNDPGGDAGEEVEFGDGTLEERPRTTGHTGPN